MAREGKKPSNVLNLDGNGFLEFFCVPCNYANKMQEDVRVGENIQLTMSNRSEGSTGTFNSEPNNLLTMERC